MSRSLALRRIYLVTDRLSSFDALVWESFLRFSLQALELDFEIVSDQMVLPNGGSDFAFLSGSEVLSRKLFLYFHNIYISPCALPTAVDTCLYYQLVDAASFHAKLQQNAKSVLFDKAEEAVEIYRNGLRPSKWDVALITSVFNGDRFLEGFLKNSSMLEGYSDYEHLLIRPESPGNEHERLFEHVREFPNAIYLGLSSDPGLYEIWNIGARLASAPYLTNANLDDRRAPAHLKRLKNVLDTNHDVSVASCALRVTEMPNLGWEDSSDCEVWFEDVAEGMYPATSLITKAEGELRPNNVPHCMPLWRRKLHLYLGYFDEMRFGPSADWEFWLRAGKHGDLFYFIREPLGLYLKDRDSYWRRNKKVAEFELGIMQRYRCLTVTDVERIECPEQPLALSLDSVLELLRDGMCFETLSQLLLSAVEVSVKGDKTATELLHKISQVYLHGVDVTKVAEMSTLMQAGDSQIFKMLVDLVHGLDWGSVNSDDFKRTLLFSGLDVFEINKDRRGLLVWAWIARKKGNDELEKLMLCELHKADRRWFWENIQDVYRFCVELTDLSAIVGDVGGVAATVNDNEKLNLVYFPDYTEGNAYQRLLYETSIASGAKVQGVNLLTDLASLQPMSACRNILHIHWLNSIFHEVSESDYVERADYFIKLINDLKGRGFEINWTIHNRVEHESLNRSRELEFRRNLFILADRVYVHHPLATEELDRLPKDSKLRLVEHGAYPQVSEKLPDRDLLRSRIGVGSGDLLLVYIGMVRDYKGLDETLPILADCLSNEPRLHLLMAGSILSEKIKALLLELPTEQVWIEDRFITEAEVESIMHAADVGFLSYRSILTSGSLFHWFSCGVPVIAPSLGTIPAYVVNGWNGFTYLSGDELKWRVEQCLSASLDSLSVAGDNARQTAMSLRWEFA